MRQDSPRYADRMFPVPVDHGLARPDRAVSTVRSGTDTTAGGGAQNELWYQGSGRIGEKAVESIVIYPPTRGVQGQGDPFEPVKIGVLIDMDLGQLLADLMDRPSWRSRTRSTRASTTGPSRSSPLTPAACPGRTT
jgi:branched-chain amino acid transport system substrate-binding protein